MSTEVPENADQRVLLLAPTMRDAAVTHEVLGGNGICCRVCGDVKELCAQISVGAGAVILPEEILLQDIGESIAHIVGRQPVWSDLPIIVLSKVGLESPNISGKLSALRNISVVERPVRVSTLLSLVRSSIRARQRQYEIRDHLLERAKSEADLRQARDAAEAANRAKDRFLATLSHELRTPLSPVLMTLTAMESDADLPEKLREDVAMMRNNIELETKLIDDLLDLNRVINGKLHLHLRSVSIHDLLRKTIQICSNEINGKQLRVQQSLDSPRDCVRADSARLQQIFWNLLKNAIKFTPEGGRIEIRTHQTPDRRLAIEMIDTGIGISAEALPRIFDAFEQGNPTVGQQFGGLGLGLGIAKALVDLHDGRITAISGGTNRGTTMTVELPLAQEDLVQRGVNLRPVNQKMAEASGSKVLLVEDHADTSRMLSRFLSLSGYQVKTVSTAAAALEIAGAEPFDIVISDIGLPDATGYDLMRQIRARYPVKGIAVSGFGMEEDIDKSRQAGFSDHIVKPINIAQLDATIRRVMQEGA